MIFPHVPFDLLEMTTPYYVSRIENSAHISVVKAQEVRISIISLSPAEEQL